MLSPMFNPQEFFLPEELLPLKKRDYPKKIMHFLAFDEAKERLQLLQAYLLKDDSFDAGLKVVMMFFIVHLPSAFILIMAGSIHEDLIDPAMKGMLNVSSSCSKCLFLYPVYGKLLMMPGFLSKMKLINTSSTDSQMYNNIMAAGSKDHPPMLGPGRYSQWRSLQAVAATEGNPAIQQHTTIEIVLNMTPENKEHFLSEKEAIFLLLTGIGDDIYSTVDACKTANEMWIAIERLQQGESLNVQDVKTNLFWEFGKFTSRDGESMESYYSRFYKLMNELTRNNLQVTTMQVNVQFLQQLQPEWSRFVTVVKQSKEIDTISYHTLFDILKQYQNEVNDIRAERIAKSANPLALLAAAQPYSDNYYQAPKPQRSNATSSSTRPSASTRHKGKEIAKPVTPQSESVSEEDSDPEQAQRDKDMQKNLALLAKYFKRLYKPTNNNLRTSSNSRNKTEDTTPRYNNDNQSGQFGNQRTMTVAG
ncbi:hypothetical protein Tco_0969113 [Tanacetum coccineum]